MLGCVGIAMVGCYMICLLCLGLGGMSEKQVTTRNCASTVKSGLASRGACWLQATTTHTQPLAKLVPSMLFWSTTRMSKQAHKVCIRVGLVAGSTGTMLSMSQD